MKSLPDPINLYFKSLLWSRHMLRLRVVLSLNDVVVFKFYFHMIKVINKVLIFNMYLMKRVNRMYIGYRL